MESNLAAWMMKLVNQAAGEAEAELVAIVEAACEKQGLNRVECKGTDALRIASIISDVQAESFRMGLHTAMRIAVKLALPYEGSAVEDPEILQQKHHHQDQKEGANETVAPKLVVTPISSTPPNN